jgi:chromosome segregation ATPase
MSASTPTVELGLILRNTQKAVQAAEAALEIAQRIESDFGHRFSALEGRFTGLEGRITTLSAGQNSLQRAVLRIADTLVEHGGRLDRIDGRLDAIEATSATLPTMDARMDDLAQSQQRIEQALAAIAAKLP